MLEILSSFLVAQTDYLNLTPQKKVAVEQLIYARKINVGSSIVYPVEISQILGVKPACAKNTDTKQIRCIWSEGDREIRAFWQEAWQIQRWESEGFR